MGCAKENAVAAVGHGFFAGFRGLPQEKSGESNEKGLHRIAGHVESAHAFFATRA
jgi:hypothetical protein